MKVGKIEGYFSKFKGSQVDEAVNRVINKLDAELELKAEEADLKALQEVVEQHYSDETESEENISNYILNTKITATNNNLTNLNTNLGELNEVVNEIDSDLKKVEDIIGTYGDIVTKNIEDFATAEQGEKAESALQPSGILEGRLIEVTDNEDGSVEISSTLDKGDIDEIVGFTLKKPLNTISPVSDAPVQSSTLSTKFTELENTVKEQVTENFKDLPLEGLKNVNVTEPVKGQVLGYTTITDENNKTSEVWSNVNPGEIINLGDLKNVVILNPTQGQTLSYDSANKRWVNLSKETSLAVSWGDIEGDILDQPDLQEAMCQAKTFTNPEITSNDGSCVWSFINSFNNENVQVTVKSIETNETMLTGVVTTASVIQITFKSSESIPEGKYKALVIGTIIPQETSSTSE